VFLDLGPAVLVSVVWGMAILVAFNYVLAVRHGMSPLRAIGEHVAMALLVVAVTHFVGRWIAGAFA
jgi:VIT1/CCC1 family predicted Fe2+/Mn2+ transporter